VSSDRKAWPASAPPTAACGTLKGSFPRDVASVLKRSLGALVLKTVVQHQPLDDPTAEAELVKPR
jgi:hypothetical protein